LLWHGSLCRARHASARSRMNSLSAPVRRATNLVVGPPCITASILKKDHSHERSQSGLPGRCSSVPKGIDTTRRIDGQRWFHAYMTQHVHDTACAPRPTRLRRQDDLAGAARPPVAAGGRASRPRGRVPRDPHGSSSSRSRSSTTAYLGRRIPHLEHAFASQSFIAASVS
jgi:hypothetical protein